MTGLLRKLKASTRTRILAVCVVLLAASTIAATVAQRQVLAGDAVDRVDRDLGADAQQLARLVAVRQPTDARELLQVYLRQTAPADDEGLYTFVDGAPFMRETGRNLGPDVTRAVEPLGTQTTADRATIELRGGRRLRFERMPVTVGGQVRGALVTVADLSVEQRRATRVARNSALAALVVLVIAAAIAFVVAGRVLAPLRRLGDTAAAITESDLTRRLEVVGNDELAELAQTFNAMLDRLEAAFASQRAFVSDAGHELRTPITIIRAHLDLMGDDPAERQATLGLVTDELGRMARLVEDLLTLAKAEQSEFLQVEDLDLDELTLELAGKARGLGDREWVVVRADPGLLRGDRQRLTQAVMNLAANAVAHTQPRGRIELAGALEGGEVVLRVTDDGPGVAAADREQIFERLRRGSGAGRDGTGLGLPIVRAIAEAHGGRVELASDPQPGARFSIHLPASGGEAHG